MKHFAFFLFLVVSLALLGCARKEVETKYQEPTEMVKGALAVNSLSYVIDQRTGLCFAYGVFGIRPEYVTVITNVPCNNDKVRELAGYR